MSPSDVPVRRQGENASTRGGQIVHSRIDSPALTVPGALQALQGIGKAAAQADIPETTLYLLQLRASQINGCGVCVDMHSRELRNAGESDARIDTVAYVRFASVYKNFQAADDFEEFVSELRPTTAAREDD